MNPRSTAARVAQVALIMGLVVAGEVLDPGVARAQSSRCAPSIQVHGEPPLRVALARALDRRSSPGKPKTAACGTMRIDVRARGSAIRLVIHDIAGRRVVRDAPDIAAAATIIETWSRRDLVSPLLAARATPTRVASASAPAASVSDRETPPVRAPSPRVASEARMFRISGGPEGAIAWDGSAWSGARVSACVGLGRVCVGVLARLATDHRNTGDAKAMDSTRYTSEFSLTVDMPFKRGRWELAPGVGIGQGTLFAARGGGNAIDEDVVSLRLMGRATVSVRLSPTWSLGIQPEVSVTPSGGGSIEYEDAPILPRLAGEPPAHLRLGIALTWGRR